MKTYDIYDDRRDAGQQLGNYLAKAYHNTPLLILGLPRGGVEVAYHVARALDTGFTLLMSKKLPFPGQPEYGFGAIAEENTVYIAQRHDLSEKTIKDIIDRQMQEIGRRVRLYRQGKPLPDIKGKNILLVDDGIATGVTLVPAIRLCRAKGAAKIIVASPVAGKYFDGHLHEADKLEILHQPEPFSAVGQVYRSFEQVTDENLLKLLDKAKAEGLLLNYSSQQSTDQ